MKMIKFFCVMVILSVLSGCSKKEEIIPSSTVDIYVSQDVDVFGNKISNDKPYQNPSSVFMPDTETESKIEEEKDDLKVYFIDVGQADSILIQLQGENILIDGGNNADGEDLAYYLSFLGVDKLDSIIATHPHEDHIGGLDVIMDSIKTEKIYMPYIQEEDTPTTKTYYDFLESILENEVVAIQPKNGEYIYKSQDAEIVVLSPDEVEKGDLNDYSIVVKLVFGETSFLFTGDASNKVNDYIMENYSQEYLETDVLKVGHHGSRTSSSLEWLSAVNPTYAVIMCEKDNRYGHPHKEVLQMLNKVKLYRTDKDGTILFLSDGETISIQTKLTGDYPLGNRKFDQGILIYDKNLP